MILIVSLVSEMVEAPRCRSDRCLADPRFPAHIERLDATSPVAERCPRLCLTECLVNNDIDLPSGPLIVILSSPSILCLCHLPQPSRSLGSPRLNAFEEITIDNPRMRIKTDIAVFLDMGRTSPASDSYNAPSIPVLLLIR
jgi:hypothetical protein